MNGHSEIGGMNDSFDILWSDSELESFTADYDIVTIRVEETNGGEVKILCHGYIGYERVGMWDEVIIESGSLSGDGEYLERCIDAIRRKSDAADSGSSLRNCRKWRHLNLLFIDGSRLCVVASHFEMSRANAL